MSTCSLLFVEVEVNRRIESAGRVTRHHERWVDGAYVR